MKASLLAKLLLAAIASSLCAAATARPLSISPAADTYVRNGASAAISFSSDAQLQVRTDTASAGFTRQAFFTFDVAQVSGTIDRATLWLRGAHEQPNGPGVLIAVVPCTRSDWSESLLTWNTAPQAANCEFGQIVNGQTSAPTALVRSGNDNWYRWDVTHIVNAQRGRGRVSFAIAGVGNQTYVAHFLSQQSTTAALRPRLKLSISDGGCATGSCQATLIDDVHTRNGTYANNALGAEQQLLVRTAAESLGSSRTAYFNFELSNAASATTATFRLYGAHEDPNSVGVSIAAYACRNSAWDEGGVTYANAAAQTACDFSRAIATTVVRGGADAWYTWDVSQLFNEQKSSGRVSLALRMTSEQTYRAHFEAKEAPASNQARLELGPVSGGRDDATSEEIKFISLWEVPASTAALDAWYQSTHSREAMQFVGPWLSRYWAYKGLYAQGQPAQFNFISYRLTEMWYDNRATFTQSQPYFYALTSPPIDTSQYPYRTQIAEFYVPARPTEKFVDAAPVTRDYLRWVYLMRYPTGVAINDGENWFLNTHAPQLSRLNGLRRFVCHKNMNATIGATQWVRVCELWFDNYDAWRQAVVVAPPAYTAPSWSQTYPYVQMASMLTMDKADFVFIR